ncbi:MAG: hypothetical protein NC898_04685 [Candidatus Omnitrophica bacterium]|nr:hypothetical protein [Candidatus Omnitrophota bacterium]MCM8793743.1 hypothetical protein [Candidatus Omnitrophota bacterium]
MKRDFKAVILIVVLGGGLFLFLNLGFSQEKVEKLEDFSKYGYTLKYKDPNVYTLEPGEKKSLYQQGEPQLPPALSEGKTPPQWSKPEKLEKVTPEQLYLPPSVEEILPSKIYDFEEGLETEGGRFSLEGFAEKIKPVIAEITGKEIEIKVVTPREVPLGTAVVPVEEETEEEPQEKPQKPLFSNEWQILLKEGRLTLRPPLGTTEEDLEKIAAYLVNLLGRGGEITQVGPEGIEIQIK